MRFEKWQGLGNDFILTERAISPAEAQALCDRRRGIGADGVLVIGRDENRDGHASMRVFNADGSRPEMCGNGLRCVAAWLAERHTTPSGPISGGPISGGQWIIDTDAGPRGCAVAKLEPGRYEVRADMGLARVTGEIRFGEPARAFITVDVGNPHAVCFDALREGEAAVLGPALERHTPGGVNVELVRPASSAFEVIVWERGVGWTEACGTGAVAVAAAAIHRRLCPASDEITVQLPGGALAIRIDAGGAASMRGPAGRVFAGEVDL